MGGLIMPIAISIDSHKVEQSKGSTRLDLESCIAMKMIAQEGDYYCFLFRNSNFTLPLPNQQRTTLCIKNNRMIHPSLDVDNNEAVPLDFAPPPPSEQPIWFDAQPRSGSSSSSSTDALLQSILGEQLHQAQV